MNFPQDIIDFAMKNYQFAGTVLNNVDKGLKKGDDRKQVLKNLESDFEYYNESLKDQIKTQLNEAIGPTTFDIEQNDDLVATITIDNIIISGSDAIVIKKIKLGENYKTVQRIIDVVDLIIKQNKDVKKFLISPNPGVVNMVFDGVNWEKVGFTRLNDSFLIKTIP